MTNGFLTLNHKMHFVAEVFLQSLTEIF